MKYERTGLWVVFSYLPEHSIPATEEITPQVAPQVTPQVERLLTVLQGTMGRDELQAALDLKDRKSFRDLYLQPALEAGLIQMTIPDKPNSRLQGYRLTPVETGEAPVETPDRIIQLLRANPQMTMAEVAEAIGSSRRAAERATPKLVADGRLRFVGPRKSGHWETLE